MQRQSIIIVTQPNKPPLPYGNFKKACLYHNLPYHSLKGLKIPITFGQLVIYRMPFL